MDDAEKVREMLTMEQVLAMIPFDRTFLFRLQASTCSARPLHFPRRRLWSRTSCNGNAIWRTRLRIVAGGAAQAAARQGRVA